MKLEDVCKKYGLEHRGNVVLIDDPAWWHVDYPELFPLGETVIVGKLKSTSEELGMNVYIPWHNVGAILYIEREDGDLERVEISGNWGENDSYADILRGVLKC